MVRTGKRATALAGLLESAGLRAWEVPRPAPRIEDLDPILARSILDTYRALGGRLEHPSLRPGAWDLNVSGLVVELDEELHFNRYREMTLRHEWARALPWTAFYLELCETREAECLKAGTWGSRWTNDSSSRMFDSGAQAGDLSSGAGAPRWKQRALYDVMKDAWAAHEENIGVARLSVYDNVSGYLLGDVLEGRATLNSSDLLGLLASRTA
jgi:hypothetical protein